MNKIKLLLVHILLDVVPVVLACLALYTALYSGHVFGSVGVARLIDEIELDNWTKVCIYERLGTTYTLTIPSLRWCPLTIEVDV